MYKGLCGYCFQHWGCSFSYRGNYYHPPSPSLLLRSSLPPFPLPLPLYNSLNKPFTQAFSAWHSMSPAMVSNPPRGPAKVLGDLLCPAKALWHCCCPSWDQPLVPHTLIHDNTCYFCWCCIVFGSGVCVSLFWFCFLRFYFFCFHGCSELHYIRVFHLVSYIGLKLLMHIVLI